MSNRRLWVREAWVFDLDNTLYPSTINLFRQMDERIRSYIANFLGLDEDAAFRLQKEYFRTYGTSLRGLMTHYQMDPGPFLAHVHDIDLSLLGPNEGLNRALRRLPGRKIVFTNASTGHAERVLDRLGIADHFSGVFDIVAAGYRPKPSIESYQALVQHFAIDPCDAVMIEDMAQNLLPAAQLGMVTVWVRNDSPHGREGHDGEHVHHIIDDLAEWLQGVASASPQAPEGEDEDTASFD